MNEIVVDEAMLEPWLLPWQQLAWQRLEQSFVNNSLHHAWIIEGDNDYAISHFTLSIAKLVNCENLLESRPCNSCNNCLQINNGSYADLHSISVLEKKTQIGVEQIREISSTLMKTAYSGKYRVVVVAQAELMTLAAANAFLKTLEEPGEKTLILIQTLYPSRLLATLRSRCQQLSLTSTNSSAIAQWLQQQFDAEPEFYHQALTAAAYKPLQSLRFLKQGLVQQRLEFFKDLELLLGQQQNLTQFENAYPLQHALKLSWMEQYLTEYFSQNKPQRSQIEHFYSVLEEIRLQLTHTRDADKPLLLREILVKWIALSGKLRHSK